MQPWRPRRMPEGANLVVGAIAAAIIGLAAAALATGLSFGGISTGAVHPAAMAVMLGLLSVPLIRWAVQNDRKLFWIVLGGLGAKTIGTAARVIFNEGGADANLYSSNGAQVAELLSNGIISPDDPRVAGGSAGTKHVTYVVGWLYHLTGARLVTAYVVFSFIAFVGMLFFYRAATTAVPNLDRVRYALLLFYMPTMLFWPSSIGKESLMIGFLGATAYGAAGILHHRYSPRYLAALTVGVAATAWIRPHVTALILCAAILAFFWPNRSVSNRFVQLAIIVVGAAAITLLLGQVADQFGAERFDVREFLDVTAGRTATGGSEFNPVRISGPLSFAFSLVTVLFRPFVIEADSAVQLASSFESLATIVLAIASARRIRELPRSFARSGYVRMTVYYSLGFVMAFSVISNFGILARQRTQLWPLILVLLALSPAATNEVQKRADPTPALTGKISPAPVRDDESVR